MLTDENLEGLVKLVNEELQSASYTLKDRMDVIDAELGDVKSRLSRLYDALETGTLKLDDLAPRIKELKVRQDELGRTRVETEAEMIAGGIQQVDVDIVKTYARDLRGLLEEADFIERKAFLRSFIKRIEVNKKQVTIHYNLPLAPNRKPKEQIEVLPIETLGGAEGIRTPDLLRAREALSQLSYSPKT